MQNINISIAGISKRFHFASLHYIFSAYLPTHIKFLTEFHRIFFGTTCISSPTKQSPKTLSTFSGIICYLQHKWNADYFIIFSERVVPSV